MKSRCKAYKNCGQKYKELREKAIQDCEKFFHGEANVGNLIKFVKQKVAFL